MIDTAERPLTVEQAAVVRAVAASGRGVEVIEALAGTGKTYTAGVLRAVYEDAGYEVIGVAPTGRAATRADRPGRDPVAHARPAADRSRPARRHAPRNGA